MRTTAYICVHGIGVHKSGDLVDDVAGVVAAGAEDLHGRFTELPLSPEAPRHLMSRAQVDIPGQEPYLAEFHDGWWSRSVPSPSFWAVLLWTLRIAPLVLLNTAVLWYRDRRVEAEGSSLRTFASALLPASLFIAAAALSVVLLPLALLIAAPIPPWRRAVISGVVDFLGDAWLYRSEELDQTVLPELKNIALTAAHYADYVVLVGHSQGAELTRRVGLRATAELQAEAPENLQETFRFVWVGSGENQLNAVRTMARSHLLPLTLWPYLLLLPLFTYQVVTTVAGFITALGTWLGALVPWLFRGAPAGTFPQPDLWALIKLLIILACVVGYILLGRFLTHVMSRPPGDAGSLPPGRGWYLQAVLDPVCFGSSAVRGSGDRRAGLEPDDEVAIRYVPQHPEQPWYSEHVSYFDKPECGHVLIEAGIESPEPLAASVAPQVPGWVLAVSALVSAVVLIGAYWVGSWQWGLLTLWRPLLMW